MKKLTDVLLTCRSFGDVALVASDRVELVKDNEKHTITIKKVLKAEEGIINVKATNEVGQMSSSARLKVTGILFAKYIELSNYCY